MAGTIIADYIRADANKLSLNVGNTTFATVNASGFFSNTGVQIIDQNGQVGALSVGTNQLQTGAVTQTKIGSNVAGTGPIFITSMGAAQTLTSAVWTKVAFDTESVDSHNCYNTSLYRFTPTVAGYYQFTLQLTSGAGNIQAVQAGLYKNGSQVAYHVNYLISVTYGDDLTAIITKLIYMNGTTDYVEPYGLVVDSSAGSDSLFGGLYCHFEGFLARAA